MNYFEYLLLALAVVVSIVVCVRACKQGKVGPQYGLKWPSFKKRS